MFLCQPLLEVLAGRGIGDIYAFIKVPSWNDFPDPLSIPSMEKAAARVLSAVRNRERISIFWRLRLAEVLSVRSKWARIRQGRSSVEVLCWEVPVTEQIKGDFLVEFYVKTRILRGFTPR